MPKKATAKKIVESLKARRQELETTLTEMIDVIDKYSLVSQFSFLNGSEGCPGEYLFYKIERDHPVGLFEAWNDKWLGKLFPTAVEANQKIEMYDETINFVDAVQKFGFLLGVLCGMKNMGASKEELLRRSEGFILSEEGYARYCAESDAESKDRRSRRKLKAVADRKEGARD
jgi:hypothetical protein